jgi:hypothetical protein
MCVCVEEKEEELYIDFIPLPFPTYNRVMVCFVFIVDLIHNFLSYGTIIAWR